MFSEITRERIGRFRRLRRAWVSFLILAAAFVLSLGSELIANDQPLYVRYEGRSFYPVLFLYSGRDFGQEYDTPADYIRLREDARFQSTALMIFPIVPYGPVRPDLASEGTPPHPPSSRHWLGTDRLGRDVLARLLYGFRTGMLFSLTLTLITALLGVIIGGVQGYLGGRVDLATQRAIEIWSALPFLYVVILVGSIYGRTFLVLVCIMSLFSWIGLSYYMRGEFLRLREATYIKAARALGLSSPRIFFRHILPNALTPMITILPFTLIGGISSLTALDFLGFGLPPPTPSWGELLQQGLQVVRERPTLTFFTTVALFVTLLLATFIGEGLREAFDPKSRQRFE